MRAVLSCVPALLLLVTALPAQKPSASALLPRDHWSITALRRLDATAPGYTGSDFSGNTFSQTEVALRLRAAAKRLAANPRWSALSQGFLERFLEEYPGERSDSARTVHLLGATAAAGLVSATGRAAPGAGWFRGEDWTGAQPMSDLQTGRGTGALSVVAGKQVAAQLAGYIDDVRQRADESQLLLDVKALEFWAGRRTVHYGPASFGIVLGGLTYFNALAFELREPVRLPWLLRHLGPLRFETMVAPLERNGRVDDPWFWAARGSIQPHRRLTLGINRAAIFGGTGNEVRFVDVLEMIAGGYGGENGEFENQVVSADLRFVIPSRLPLEFYAEWGSDDGAGMWHRAPALTLGSWLYALPGTTAAFVRLEWTTFFPKPDAGNTYWYRNVFFRGSWSNDGAPLGHPLGGHGQQLSLLLGADLLDARLRLRARGYARDRAAENVYSPERAGNSLGLGVDAVWRVGRLQAELRGDREDGKGWQRRRLSANLRGFFF